MRRLPRRARGSAFALAVLLGGAVAILTACGVQPPPESAAPDPTPWVVAPLTTPLPTPAEEATPTPSEWPEWRDWVINVRNDNAQPVRLVIHAGVSREAVGMVVPEAVQPGEWLDVILSLPRPDGSPARGSWELFIYVGSEHSGSWGVPRWARDLDPTELYVGADGQVAMGTSAAQQGDQEPWEWPEDTVRPPDRG